MTPFAKARVLALLIPAALLAGAWGSQLIGHLYPCEMCHWQRWPHYAALPFALLAFVPKMPQRLFVAIAAIAIATSGAIGVAHAGVEYHWWNGFTPCTATFGNGGDLLTEILKAPIIRCDVAQWTLFGISLAGFNAIISLSGAAAIFYFLTRRSARG
ncbi:MAG: disulfide bond formation protein B [Pseudomonadota bacterium]